MNTSHNVRNVRNVRTTRHARRAAFAAAGILALLPAVAGAQAITGVQLNERVFNDFSTTTLITSNTGNNPANVSITERGYVDDMAGGNFANRHDAVFTSGGAVRTLSITEGFTMSMIVNLATTNNAPRKEAGFRISGNPTGDALFLVNSDAGEIVAFGGGAPFRLFGNNGNGNGYATGTPLFMGVTYVPDGPDADNRGTIEYFINRTAANGLGAGLETSGPLNYDNLEGGPVNFTIGAYTQITPNLTTGGEENVVTFTNLTAAVVPEPTMLAALGLAGLLVRRRRA